MQALSSEYLALIEKYSDKDTLSKSLTKIVLDLGFEYWAYGFKMPLPVSKYEVVVFDTYPSGWYNHYKNSKYLQIDPVVAHGTKSQTPVVWSDTLFQSAPKLWDEAKHIGLRHGWSQSSLDSMGVGGMLSVVRSRENLTKAELDSKAKKLDILSQVVHNAYSRIIKSDQLDKYTVNLTPREIDVLKWSADGKSSQDIADILGIAKNTVDFHIKNAILKLQAVNKTAAVIRAYVLGYLL